MANEYTAVFERDGEWYIAYCPEISGANGQGKTKDEARASLREAIALILERDPPLAKGLQRSLERAAFKVQVAGLSGVPADLAGFAA